MFLYPAYGRTFVGLSTPSTQIFLCQTPRRPKVERRFFALAKRFFDVQLIFSIKAKDTGERYECAYACEFLCMYVCMTMYVCKASRAALFADLKESRRHEQH